MLHFAARNPRLGGLAGKYGSVFINQMKLYIVNRYLRKITNAAYEAPLLSIKEKYLVLCSRGTLRRCGIFSPLCIFWLDTTQQSPSKEPVFARTLCYFVVNPLQ